MIDRDIVEATRKLVDICRRKSLTIATAESCTGGLVAGALTEVPGVSSLFERGFVTYSNRAKHELLGVPHETLDAHGAVSEAVARAMAEGAIKNSPADLAVSITGIAGPDGGSEQKPVGLVHFGGASRGGQRLHTEKRYGDTGRADIRKQSVLQAMVMLHDLAEREASRA